jgi:hypothetical protein
LSLCLDLLPYKRQFSALVKDAGMHKRVIFRKPDPLSQRGVRQQAAGKADPNDQQCHQARPCRTKSL